MLKKILKANPDIIEEAAQAFLDYPYETNEKNQFLFFKNKERIKKYLSLYFEAGIKSSLMYTYENKGYMILSDSKSQFCFWDSIRLFFLLLSSMGLKHMQQYMMMCNTHDPSLETILKNKKRDFIHIEMIVILPAFQKQGLLRKMLQEVESEAKKRHVPIILETDCLSKSNIYQHLGYRLKSKREFSEHFIWYDLYKKASDL